VNEGEAKTCSRCGGEMVKATAEVFGNIFGCTRVAKNLEALQGEKIQA